MLKHLRVGKVFVDWSQNDALKPRSASIRFGQRISPTVSTPLTWDEVAAALREELRSCLSRDDVLVRVQKCGDLFEARSETKAKASDD